MLLDLLNMLSAFSLYSLSTDCPVSYSWKLRAGEQLHVVALRPGAVFSVSPSADLTIASFTFGPNGFTQGPAPTVDTQGVANVTADRLEITAKQEVSFTINVSFPHEKPAVIPEKDGQSLLNLAAPAAPPHHEPKNAREWGTVATLSLTGVAAVALAILLVSARRRLGPNEHFELTDEAMSDFVPPVIPQACP